jgi:hypothetical protein
MSTEYDKGLPLLRASEFYEVKKVSKTVIYVFAGVLLIIMLGIEVFCGFLLALHAVLYNRGISTYELIVYRRQKKAELDAQVREGGQLPNDR